MGDSEVSSMWQWKRLSSKPHPGGPVCSGDAWGQHLSPDDLLVFALSAVTCSEPVLLSQTQPSSPCLILWSHFSLEKSEELSLDSKLFLSISMRGGVAASPAAQVNGNILLQYPFHSQGLCELKEWPGFIPPCQERNTQWMSHSWLVRIWSSTLNNTPQIQALINKTILSYLGTPCCPLPAVTASDFYSLYEHKGSNSALCEHGVHTMNHNGVVRAQPRKKLDS